MTAEIISSPTDWNSLWPGSSAQAVLFGVAAGLFALAASRKKGQKYRLPPGPKGFPLLGNLLAMGDTTEGFCVKLARWAKEKYGPVVSIYMGPILVVTLNNSAVATEALLKKEDFDGRPKMHSLWAWSMGYKNIGLDDLSPTWKKRRSVLIAAIHTYMSGLHLQDVVQECIRQAGDKMAMENGAFDPNPYSNKMMFRIADALCFGGNIKSFDDAGLNAKVELFQFLNTDVGNGFFEDFVPYLYKWPTKKWKIFEGHLDEFKAYIGRQVDQKRASFSSDKVSDLCSALLLAQLDSEQDEGGEKAFRDEHVVPTLLDVYGASIESSRVALNWAFLMISYHQEVQKKMQAELDRVTGDRLPGEEDRPDLPYTQAAVLEALRFGVINPLALPHKALCDTTVAGYDVPKGTIVLQNQWAVLRDPEVWPEPNTFRPERFLDSNGALKASVVRRWGAFGGGRRRCVGDTVTKSWLTLTVACLLKRFDWRLQSGVTPNTTPHWDRGMEHCMPRPFNMTFTPRKQTNK